MTLLVSTEYYVIVEETAIRNNSATPEYYAGITDPFVWSFTTSDGSLAVETLSPDDEIIDGNHPTFVMVFNEEVELTDAGGSIHVVAVGETVPVLDIVLEEAMVAGTTVTIDYVYDAVAGGLNINTDYYVTVDASALQDMTGNDYEGISDETEWTFTTGADFATDVEDPIDGSLEFKVYPNPFADYVKVDYADELSNIIITNVAGQRVKDIVNPTNVISTGELRSGIYFITLVKGDVVVKTERIVKR